VEAADVEGAAGKVSSSDSAEMTETAETAHSDRLRADEAQFRPKQVRTARGNGGLRSRSRRSSSLRLGAAKPERTRC
jgi:hypothetical protein